MKDLLLSKDHDLVIDKFDLQLTNDKQLVKQRIRQALLAFKGDWFLNTSLGIPYYEEIVGQKNSIDTVKAIFIETIKKVDGVKDLVEFNINLENQSQSLNITFTVIDYLNNRLNMEF